MSSSWLVVRPFIVPVNKKYEQDTQTYTIERIIIPGEINCAQLEET